ncbi:MAG: flagellar biosynthesis protein FlgN [Treponema sp.]|nr:flagellar biosynthesis protein FlgN [Treponema sp.]
MQNEISEDELAERIAILKRFRELLEQQRRKFQEYLNMLELQENKITEDNAESIVIHSNLEEQIVSGINSLQKVILPMQKMYDSINSKGKDSYKNADSEHIFKLQQELSHLRTKVLAQNEKNQTLLKNRLVTLRKEILSIKNPYKSSQSIYAEQAKTGSLVHIEA